jgi:hypothetical protein
VSGFGNGGRYVCVNTLTVPAGLSLTEGYVTTEELRPGTPSGPAPLDTAAEAVSRRLDDVCADLLAGRTTAAQRRGLRGAVDRADRVAPASDAAVGRVLGR